MTMNRVIHAAVRRDLTRLESALDAAPYGDRARARRLATAYANLHRELKHHHEGEDNNVFPFLARVEGATELIVAKNRNGTTGFVDLYFYHEWLRFEDMVEPGR